MTNNVYTIKCIDLTDDKDYKDFTGRIDIEKVDNQLFTDDELDNLEKLFYYLPVVVTDNETGVSLWMSDNHCVDDIMETVKAELVK